MFLKNATENAKTQISGQYFDDDESIYGVVKYQCQYPNKRTISGCVKHVSTTFIAKYWMCSETVVADKANMERKLETVDVKVGSTVHKIGVPVLVNTKVVEKGDELFVSKTASDKPSADHEGPEFKRIRTSSAGAPLTEAASSDAKGKGKGKGKKGAAAKPKAKAK